MNIISGVSFGRSQATIQRRKETKAGLESAEQVLRNTQNKYGRTNSATYIQLKVNAHKDNPAYADVSRRLLENAEKYREELQFRPYKSITWHNAEKTADSEGLLGDCGECAQAVQKEFIMQEGKPTVNIVMEVEKANGGFCNHAFNLSNIEEGAQPTDPKTWGKKAIVTDLWSGIAKKSDEAIEYFQELFKVNPSTDKITFDAMPDRESSLQNAVLKHFNMQTKTSNPFANY